MADSTGQFGKRAGTGLPHTSNKNPPGPGDAPDTGGQPPAKAKKVRETSLDTIKGVIGFIVGFACAGALEIAILALLFDGSTSTPRVPGLAVFPIITGIATASIFKKNNWNIFFARVSHGMNPRLPIAIFVSWLLALNFYLLLFKDSFGDWYDDNSAKYWSMIFAIPAVVVAILIVFRWAASSKKQ